ncbi:MAG: helix-turn-helix domain-containing protein [Patescibacteria group bacterium]|nr:helix-turn-helix domain-containing protein [Patescibacteria group bacterium]
MIKNNFENQFYTIEEIAKILKVSYLTVYRWIRAKKLSAYKIEKQYRIKKIDFDLFIKNYKK